MATITIPNDLTPDSELVLITKEEYENLLQLKKVREFKPTDEQKEALFTSRENYKKGNALTHEQFIRELET